MRVMSKATSAHSGPSGSFLTRGVRQCTASPIEERRPAPYRRGWSRRPTSPYSAVHQYSRLARVASEV